MFHLHFMQMDPYAPADLWRQSSGGHMYLSHKGVQLETYHFLREMGVRPVWEDSGIFSRAHVHDRQSTRPDLTFWDPCAGA